MTSISLNSYSKAEQMGKVTIRTGLTSQGTLSMNPWLGDRSIYEFSTVNKGNNSISLLEIVSALNSFNLGHSQYHFNYLNCVKKYNPKVYLGAVQSVAKEWILDLNKGLPGSEKSGSWQTKTWTLLPKLLKLYNAIGCLFIKEVNSI